MTKRVRFPRLIIRTEKRRHEARKIDELLRRGYRDTPKNKRVDHGESDGAGAEGKGQRRDCGKACSPVLANHAQAELEIPEERLEPDGGFHVAAGFAKLEPVSQLAAREPIGLGADKPLADQIRGPFVEVELEFLIEVRGGAPRAKGIGDARNPGHKRLLKKSQASRRTWPTAAATEVQRRSSSCSCFRPAGVISYTRARRLFSVVVH